MNGIYFTAMFLTAIFILPNSGSYYERRGKSHNITGGWGGGGGGQRRVYRDLRRERSREARRVHGGETLKYVCAKRYVQVNHIHVTYYADWYVVMVGLNRVGIFVVL